MATEDHLNAAYVRVHDAGEKYQAAYMASLPTSPAPEVGLEIPVPQSDQGELDQMRADVKRFGAEYERIADKLGLSRQDRLAWRHYLDRRGDGNQETADTVIGIRAVSLLAGWLGRAGWLPACQRASSGLRMHPAFVLFMVTAPLSASTSTAAPLPSSLTPPKAVSLRAR